MTSRPRSERKPASSMRSIAAVALTFALTPLTWSAETEPSPAGAAVGPTRAAAAEAAAANAKQGKPTKATGHPTKSASASKTAGAATNTGTAAAAPTQLVCFRMSIQCFTTANAKPSPKTVGPVAAMDLRAPEITRIFPRTELAEKLPEPAEQEAPETVEISGQREFAPVSVGLMALPWAVLHPTQAWRIFMPLPPSESK